MQALQKNFTLCLRERVLFTNKTRIKKRSNTEKENYENARNVELKQKYLIDRTREIL